MRKSERLRLRKTTLKMLRPSLLRHDRGGATEVEVKEGKAVGVSSESARRIPSSVATFLAESCCGVPFLCSWSGLRGIICKSAVKAEREDRRAVRGSRLRCVLMCYDTTNTAGLIVISCKLVNDAKRRCRHPHTQRLWQILLHLIPPSLPTTPLEWRSAR
jgi:hypothetical protein